MPVILAIISDTHPNSMVGLCPAKGVLRTDGETQSKHLPGREQKWIWRCYEDIIERLAKLKEEIDCELWAVKNGDGADDNTHSKYGLITPLTDEIVEIGYQCDLPLLQVADRIFIVNGTEAHVGRGAALEKLIAKRIHDEYEAGKHSCQVSKSKYGYTKWTWQFVCSGVHVYCQHKPPSSDRKPNTRGNGAGRTAFILQDTCDRMGWKAPDVAYYAHYHRPVDSGENHSIRVFFNPCMKLHGSWESGMGFQAEPIGIRVAICDDGKFYPQPMKEWLYYPKGNEIWKPT